MKIKKYLTKSRFKVGYECPAKLYYNELPKVYANKNLDNEFLQALAHGGFQVGALAKLHYPHGIDLEELKTEEAIQRTNELLENENVTIFEAAIQHGSFLVRVDILVKEGNKVSLIEVKSKSYDPIKNQNFFKKRDPGIDSKWDSYITDIAFQAWVTKEAHPNWIISPFLFLPNKQTKASVDGLHQNFKLVSNDQKSKKIVTKPDLKLADIGDPILALVPVQNEVDYIIFSEIFPTEKNLPQFAHYLAQHHLAGTRAESRLNGLCKSCEFRTEPKPPSGLKSGFMDCWSAAGKFKPTDQGRHFIFDIWNLRKSEDFLAKGISFFDQLTEEDLRPKSKPKKTKALESYQRQWLQIEKTLNNDPTPYIDNDGLKDLFNGVTYPIHCIDFETTMAAIPFHRGRRPYEQIVFQFSHHILHEDGRIEHADQYLDMRPGIFPNFDFLRRLKESLSKDNGTIFRYATHENTVLRQIRDQLQDTPQPDQEELIRFIDLITKPRGSEEGQAGLRNMIDLREVVLEHYYHPLMGRSNSIKKVIPAVLEESELLKGKYSKPIYGQGQEINSLNFTNPMTWIELDQNGKVIDPYKRLPPVFSDLPQGYFESDAPLFDDESIDDGGAAMTAWSRMQFTEMSDAERNAIKKSLLKYCELDTLSMVWLLEYFKSLNER